ncbi:hypothetical protein Q3G72_018865 [Acer saccharum]|nr:hypothetical protein Q3G72_018865 [Acer saccharum]
MAREITNENQVHLFAFSFFAERAVIFLLILFSLSEFSFLPGFSSLFDPNLGYLVDIPLLTTFAQMFFLKFSEKIYHDYDSRREMHKEANDKFDRELQGTIEIKKNNCHNKESEEAKEKLDCGKEESKTIRVDKKENKAILNQEKEEENELEKIKGCHCLNLEEEKKNLMLKLDIANETLGYCQVVVKDFTEHSRLWHEEKKVLSAKLEAASTPTTTTNIAIASQNHQESHQEFMKNSEENCPRQDNDQYYFADNSLSYDHYHSYFNNRNLHDEKQELTAKLDTARHTLEFYKACLNDYEEICRNLRMEITEVSAKHFAETVSTERYHKLLNELEDKYRRLEEERNDLSAKLIAAKASSELYRNFLHDSFLHDYEIVPHSTS